MDSVHYIFLTLIPITFLLGCFLGRILTKKKPLSLLDQHRLLLSQERQHNLQLMNLLLAKDPMTFSTLMSQTTPSISNGYIPSGTDEAEAQRYAELMSHHPVGEEIDYAEDFGDSGILRDGG